MDRILLLTGDTTGSNPLSVLLQREQFLPILAGTLEEAIHSICLLKPDFVITEVPVNRMGSVEVCMRLQACNMKASIMILSESNAEIDKVLALEAGADCYMIKPFGPRELVARIRALLRRNKLKLDPVIRFGNVEVDRDRRTVTCCGQEIRMSPYEYKLLLFFLSNVDFTLTRQILLRSVWGYSDDANTRTLDAHVSRLRNKCERDPNAPRHFVTIHGVGYRFIM